MSRITKDEQRINFMCEELGFKPKTVYELTKMMLREYRRDRVSLNVSAVSRTEKQITIEKQLRRREFLEIMRLPISKSRMQQEHFIFKVLESEWMQQKVEMILDEVEDFRAMGSIYRGILETCYLSEDPQTNEEATRIVGISETALDYRKREAIKLFGVKMWSYALRRENEDKAAGVVGRIISA